ncbi:LPXTG-motif cell wall-anchored protein [Streptomyces aurantiacus]|uniref:LAETG motif-containing sortase-dependent surface protein n=1 Tax=Streptomyces aurantiacus TaxID=47760 RepID=UPI002794605E|nr:LAETG motif-containing sortase-dependent surface protein [Streptomyces aurantiacus]MDQ0774878.1 LPXTG-motif cell wall-anchored protein [Streptomyces aurantiacus]
MSARRSLLTATAAGTLLGALWFVPSANATDDKPAEHTTRTTTTTTTVLKAAAHTSADSPEKATTEISDTTESTETRQTADGTSAVTHTRLADTGSFDTTPYVAGGTLLLGVGAGFVVFSVRRERSTAY